MQNLVDFFNVVLLDDDQARGEVNIQYCEYGFVLDFIPNDEQVKVFENSTPLNVNTLFSREERLNESVYNLIGKQILHYVEVYGLNKPGLFNLEINEQTKVVLKNVKGVYRHELNEMVRKVLYMNAPVKDAVMLFEIVKKYDIEFELNKVQNNELRVMLFDISLDTFDNGDDAVRYICYKATGNPMIIKNRETIAAITNAFSTFSDTFLRSHENVLSQVFNRHKKLILATKNPYNRTAINKISRMSKTRHIPLQESIAKSFVSKALKNKINGNIQEVLSKNVSIRDMFKYLNLLEYKKLQARNDFFNIRNGKIFVKDQREIFEIADINRVEREIMIQLRSRLSHLKNKTIVLDESVDYGLPISRKQTLGNLPYGTKVEVDTKTISSGVYWRNEWGAADLDLSAINTKLERVGWGSMRGYTSGDIVFSGDLTNARDGAMEFMTSDDKSENYMLTLNVYSGNIPCGAEIVVGSSSENQWIENAIIREKFDIKKKQAIIGFVKGKQYIVFYGDMGSRRISSELDSIYLQKGQMNFWTLSRLFDRMDIPYTYDNSVEKDHDLSYASFSYDKLEDLFDL